RGLAPEALLAVLRRARTVTQLLLRPGPQKVDARQRRPQLQGLCEIVDGGRVLLPLLQGDAAVEVGLPLVRQQANRVLEVGIGAVAVPWPGPRQTPIEMGPPVFGP